MSKGFLSKTLLFKCSLKYWMSILCVRHSEWYYVYKTSQVHAAWGLYCTGKKHTIHETKPLPFFKKKEIFIFFPLPFSPLIPASFQQSPHCCTCPWVLFTFCYNPSTPNLPRLAVIPLSIYESVPIFLIGPVCSLDSIYEWSHMVCVFLWLPYFT